MREGLFKLATNRSRNGNTFDDVFMPVRTALQDIFLEQLNGARLATSVKLRFNLFKWYSIEQLLKEVIIGGGGGGKQ